MGYVWLMVSIAAMTASNLFLKEGTNIVGEASENLSELPSWYLKFVSNPYTLSAGFFFVLAIIGYTIAVSRLKLSYIYPLFVAIPLAFVVVFSLLLFEEEVTGLGWLGIVIICGGVFLVAIRRESSGSKL